MNNVLVLNEMYPDFEFRLTSYGALCIRQVYLLTSVEYVDISLFSKYVTFQMVEFINCNIKKINSYNIQHISLMNSIIFENSKNDMYYTQSSISLLSKRFKNKLSNCEKSYMNIIRL